MILEQILREKGSEVYSVAESATLKEAADLLDAAQGRGDGDFGGIRRDHWRFFRARPCPGDRPHGRCGPEVYPWPTR